MTFPLQPEDPAAETVPVPVPVTVVVLEHDPIDPVQRLGDWLVERGVTLDVRRLHAGDPLPAVTELEGLVSLGGRMDAWDDATTPWMADTRRLLAQAVDVGVPTLGICLGAQLLALATGGAVARGDRGPELGAHLVSRRDSVGMDPVFADIPLTPDVMHFHHDVVTALPPGAELLLSSIGYPHQGFRVGRAAWGVQFHLETTAEAVRDWGRQNGHDVDNLPRFGAVLDEAEELMGVVWRQVIHRYVDQVVQYTTGHTDEPLLGRRLPLDGRA